MLLHLSAEHAFLTSNEPDFKMSSSDMLSGRYFVPGSTFVRKGRNWQRPQPADSSRFFFLLHKSWSMSSIATAPANTPAPAPALDELDEDWPEEDWPVPALC